MNDKFKEKNLSFWMGGDGEKGKGMNAQPLRFKFIWYYRVLVFKFEMCKFLFGTQTLIYQKLTKGVVGGGLGRSSLLISQYYFWNLFYIMYDISVLYFWFFRNKFLEYYKLYFCHKTLHIHIHIQQVNRAIGLGRSRRNENWQMTKEKKLLLRENKSSQCNVSTCMYM